MTRHLPAVSGLPGPTTSLPAGLQPGEASPAVVRKASPILLHLGVFAQCRTSQGTMNTIHWPPPMDQLLRVTTTSSRRLMSPWPRLRLFLLTLLHTCSDAMPVTCPRGFIDSMRHLLCDTLETQAAGGARGKNSISGKDTANDMTDHEGLLSKYIKQFIHQYQKYKLPERNSQ